MARRQGAPGMAELKARLRDYLTAHRLSDAKFAQLSGLSDSTINRLVQLPSYHSTADTWRTVARTCGWNEDEVLALGGFQAAAPTEARGWALVSQGLTQLGVPVARQEALRIAWGLEGTTPAAQPNSARTVDN